MFSLALECSACSRDQHFSTQNITGPTFCQFLSWYIHNTKPFQDIFILRLAPQFPSRLQGYIPLRSARALPQHRRVAKGRNTPAAPPAPPAGAQKVLEFDWWETLEDTIEFSIQYNWANYNNSLIWIKAIWGWFPLLTMISSELVVSSL